MTNYANPYGQPYPHGAVPPGAPGQKPKRRIPWWGWALIILSGLTVLSCGGCLALVAYIGAKGPDTKVYTANEVPAKFVDIARRLGLLDPGEQVKFFYSDALVDIEKGFYFATDKKVVVYIKSAATPATIVPYSKIDSVDLKSSDSWTDDGTITLKLRDSSVVAFPVSSEEGRDKHFADWIEKSMGKVK
jgi:hypothetical protein